MITLLLTCTPGPRGGPLPVIQVFQDGNPVITRVQLADEIELFQDSNQLEWARRDLTLPSVENKAYRLKEVDDSAVWMLTEYALNGNRSDYSLICNH
ncbi:MAG: hypothetical protein COT73_03550 [Bdellovibrio sp. CG10_big_fil_rev_8_21_14_0_10_47_8]|nr:MAG: hypothetical protein COT73_03550 [Bdellovibrio sp. CG10_big_fil_rev_8_21_14_0_10_47_8]